MPTLTYVISGGPDGEQRHELLAPGEGQLVLTATHENWSRITAGE